MLKKLSLAILALLITTGMAYAETAEEILKKASNVGLTKGQIDKLKTLHIKGEIQQGQMKQPIDLYIKNPGKLKLETQQMGMPQTVISDGKEAIVMAMGQTMPVPKEQLEMAKGQFVSFLSNPTAEIPDSITVTLEGKTKQNGTDHYTIKAAVPNGDETYFYINCKTYELYKIWAVKKDAQTNQPSELEIFFKDIRKSGEYKFAYTMTIKMPSGEVNAVFETIEVNKPIDDSVFKIPETAKAAPAPNNTMPSHPDGK